MAFSTFGVLLSLVLVLACFLLGAESMLPLAMNYTRYVSEPNVPILGPGIAHYILNQIREGDMVLGFYIVNWLSVRCNILFTHSQNRFQSSDPNYPFYLEPGQIGNFHVHFGHFSQALESPYVLIQLDLGGTPANFWESNIVDFAHRQWGSVQVRLDELPGFMLLPHQIQHAIIGNNGTPVPAVKSPETIIKLVHKHPIDRYRTYEFESVAQHPQPYIESLPFVQCILKRDKVYNLLTLVRNKVFV